MNGTVSSTRLPPPNRLARERQRRGWSQQEVADQVGTTPLNVSRWERGLTKPSPYFRHQLVALFNLSAQALGILPDIATSSPDYGNADNRAADGASKPLYDHALPQSMLMQPLVAREQELNWLKRQLLTDKPIALAALKGLPGTGKTALALALLADPEVRQYFDGGFLWASLGPEDNLWEELSRWGALLDLDASKVLAHSTLETWTAALRAAAGTRRFLIVIDNVWQLQDALHCMIGGHHCAYLLTTRFPQIALSFASENVLTLSEFNEQQSMQFLRSLAPEVMEQAPQQLASLVRAYGGLPLALTALGRYLQQLHVHRGHTRRLHSVLSRLHERQARLQLSNTPLLPGRIRHMRKGAISLDAAIARNEQHLSELAQWTLRALSVFAAKPASFSEVAATEVCRVPVETFDELSDAGLLESPEPGRYTLHPVLADYGRMHREADEPLTRLIDYTLRYIAEHTDNQQALRQERAMLQAALEAFQQLHRQDPAGELLRQHIQ